MSRPKQLVHRDQSIQFMVTHLEKKAVQLNAEKLNTNVSNLCRQSLFNIRIYKPLSDDDIEVYKTLVRYKTDFDRIATYFKNSDPHFADEVLRVARELKEHLQKFKK